jgi:hypothetical protein
MIIFVLGMHRSGTSMVTGILHICGAWLGENLLMGAKDNPKGHFENKDFVHINQKILRTNNGRWDKPPRKIRFDKYIPKMNQFLESLPSNRVVVLKDPRTALTFPLWRQLIQLKNIKIIYIQRDHKAIARSLKARNNFSIEKGIRLSKYYNKQIENHLKTIPADRIFNCNFNDFFADYFDTAIESLCDFAELPEIFENKKLWNKINKFITPELRHWK